MAYILINWNNGVQWDVLSHRLLLLKKLFVLHIIPIPLEILLLIYAIWSIQFILWSMIIPRYLALLTLFNEQ